MESDSPAHSSINKLKAGSEDFKAKTQIKDRRHSLLALNSVLNKAKSKILNPYDCLITSTASRNMKREISNKEKKTAYGRVLRVTNSKNDLPTKQRRSILEGNQSFYMNMLEKYQLLNKHSKLDFLSSVQQYVVSTETGMEDKCKLKNDELSSSFKVKAGNDDRNNLLLRENSKFICKSENFLGHFDRKNSKNHSKLKNVHIVKGSSHLCELENLGKNHRNSKLQMIDKANIVYGGASLKQNSIEINHSTIHKGRNFPLSKKKTFSFLCCY